MFNITRIQQAIKFATQVHEIDWQQKRKGSGVSYIIHPLTCGIILSAVDASDDVVIAGILHDTIEDSITEKKITKEILKERFGVKVANLVGNVTEFHKERPWSERKQEAIDHIREFSHDALLVKSADILSNATDVIDDYEKEGEKIFKRFKATKKDFLQNYLRVIAALITAWEKNPLKNELSFVAGSIYQMGPEYFMLDNPAKIIEYDEYDERTTLDCHICGWSGTPKGSGMTEYSDDLLSISCPVCSDMLLIVNYPLVKL